MRLEVATGFVPQTSDTQTYGQPAVSGTEKSEIKVLAVSEEELSKLVDQANKTLVGANTHLEFTIHSSNHRIIVKVMNTDTDEVIREIPPEKFIDMIDQLLKQAGILMDEKR
ncbi:flagellar protein FlaG [Paenibacillus sp. RC84]|uniref:flagellar protein FlaG n=1 Tax=Paenibacillus sp. RC84 TaxID=3156252 RepID=UPI0035136F04